MIQQMAPLPSPTADIVENTQSPLPVIREKKQIDHPIYLLTFPTNNSQHPQLTPLVQPQLNIQTTEPTSTTNLITQQQS